MKDVFDAEVTAGLITRIRALRAEAQPVWGRMNVAQMLAHCSVAYEMVYENKHRRSGPILRWILRTFVKPGLVSGKPFPRNAPTTPAFKVPADKDFEAERDRLIAYLEQTLALGGAAFEGRDNASFGPMTRKEWSGLFHKHLDHHLTQFGV